MQRPAVGAPTGVYPLRTAAKGCTPISLAISVVLSAELGR